MIRSILALSALVISGTSFASGSGSGSGSASGSGPVPLRMATVRGHLTKMTAAYSPLKVKTEKVCDIQGDVPVFAPKTVGSSLANLPTCNSTVKGKPVTIVLSTDMTDAAVNADGDVYKQVIGIMNITQPGVARFYNAFASAGNPDLKAQAIFLSFSSQDFETDKPRVDESFTFDLVYEDKNQ